MKEKDGLPLASILLYRKFDLLHMYSLTNMSSCYGNYSEESHIEEDQYLPYWC